MKTGTKRLCQGGEHKVIWDTTPTGGHWYHEKREHWLDKPHKASPRKHKGKNANVEQERET